MRTVLALSVALVFASVATADWFDDFDSYADQAAFDGVYGAGGMTLDQTKGYSDGQSISNVSRTSNLITLDEGYVGTDAAPLEFKVMTDVDVLHWWTRCYVGMYAYDEVGTLLDLFAVGFTSAGDQARYHYRAGADPLWGWGSIDDGSGDPVFERTTEWRELKAIIKSTTIEFYVDGVLGNTITKPAAGTDVAYNRILLGTTYSSQENVWFDDLSISVIPEPATLTLLALGGLALLRRR